MQKRIKIKNRQFEYTLKKKRGARSMRLSIYPDGNFVVTAPKWYPLYVIRKFLEKKSDWIYEKLENIDFKKISEKKKNERINYLASKKAALAIIRHKVEFFNRYYNFSYNRVNVKNQKTCWGSASQKRNLNFNYKIIDLPEELRDYVIVHELCHLSELNHSWKFWELVGKTMPDYKDLIKKLKKSRN